LKPDMIFKQMKEGGRLVIERLSPVAFLSLV
jgi:hypothetical protein